MKRGFIALVLFIIFFVTACQPGGNVIKNGPLKIKTLELPVWIAPGSATYKLDIAGGVPPYSFALSLGQLPEGFYLGPDGTIGGLARLPPYTSTSLSPAFTIIVRDSAGNFAQATYTIKIVETGLEILPSLPVTCHEKVECDVLLATAQGGSEPYYYQSDSFMEGAPPMGTAVGPNGHLTGTPSKAGEYTIGICVVDKIAHSKCGHVTVKVEKSVKIEGTWVGGYTETENSQYCVSRNKGSLRFAIKSKGDSFSGSVADQGTTVGKSLSGDASCGGQDYRLSGTVSGSVVGDIVSGNIRLANSEVAYLIPFTATMTEDVMTGSYSGKGVFDGGSSRVSGSFKLTKQS